MKYCFYYDESEHSRVINLSTVTGETYYDGFLAAIIGWRSDHETAFEQRYHAFEEKYADRKKKGELKSGTIKPKQLVHGFASLNEANVKLLGAFFSIFDENSYIYLFCASKIEYVITQIFKGYRNSVFFDMDAARYSIVKAIVTYRPREVIESLYKSPAEFVAALMTFLTNRIRRNKKNRELKAQENTAFEAVLYVLNNVDVPQSLAWDYHSQFVGFGNFLSSKGILDYSVLLDKEGEAGAESKTLIAAKEASLKNCEEADSIDHFGIRMADMLVGVIGKLMKSLYHSLTPTQDSPRIAKTLLSKEWFRLTDGQLQLYKQLYHIVFEINNDWYKVYAGNCYGTRISNDHRLAGQDILAVILVMIKNVIYQGVDRLVGTEDVPAFRKSFVAFFKLLHGREDYAVCLSVCKQFFQILAALSVLRRLPEEVLAAGELSVKLVVQIVTVGNDNDSGAF